MRHTIRIALLAIVVTACLLGAGAQQAAALPADVLVLPGASAQVIRPQLGELQIAYDVADPAWRAALDRRLRERGWIDPNASSPYDMSNYVRVQRYWVLTLSELVAVRGTSTRAEITLRRRFHLLGMSFP
jgi:hypothetical protein